MQQVIITPSSTIAGNQVVVYITKLAKTTLPSAPFILCMFFKWTSCLFGHVFLLQKSKNNKSFCLCVHLCIHLFSRRPTSRETGTS